MQGRKPKCRCVTKHGLFAVFFLLGNPPNRAVGIGYTAAIITVACAGHFLNGQYTVYGQVASGMEHVDAIVKGEPPKNPDKMISVKVAADV